MKINKTELWKDIPEYEGFYQVSSLGRIKSLERKVWIDNKKCYRTLSEKIKSLQKYTPKDGSTSYYKIILCKEGKINTFWVHRLVAQAFIDNPDNLSQVNHIDENGLNNCINNLEWCTHKYNNQYGTKNQRCAEKLEKPVDQFDKNGNYIRSFKSLDDAAKFLNKTNSSNICKVCKGERKTAYGYIWKYKN